MADVTIRPAESGDVPAILETLKAALGETPILRRTESLWNWKHVDNPFGRSLVLIAEAEGRIAGVRAMMRWRLITRDGEHLECLRPVDTATHPDFLRRGIFKTLTLAVLDEARAQGFDLVFNTPNDKSAPGYLKMGWKLVSPIGVLVRPRPGRAVRPDPKSPPQIDELAPSLQPATAMPKDTAERPPRGLRTPRDRRYLDWRFTGHPTADYGWLGDESGGGLVARASTRGSRSELVVSDLLGLPAPSVVRAAGRRHKARYMAGWFSPTSVERGLAIRGGMLPMPGLKTLQLVALPLTKLDIDVFDLVSWDIATSDLELL